jgi:hypothetical protein
VNLRVRVDARYLDQKEVHGILEGEGFSDLDRPSMAWRRPREGMVTVSSEDFSAGGMALRGGIDFKKGMAFALDVHLPNDSVVIKALAEVMWVQMDNTRHRAGLRIAAIHWMELQRLSRAMGCFEEN